MMEEWNAWFSPRLSLGLGNPNSAGALLAMVLVSGLPFCLGSGWRRGVGVLLAVVMGLGIAMTASRGAVVALGVGLLVLGWRGTGGPAARADRWLLVAVAMVVGTLFWASPAGERVHLPRDDASLASRGTVFSRVPAMVAAAPEGWGAGRSAEAYQNWFQPVGDMTRLRHVLSTHAIWLVERGWVAGWLYLGGWGLALVWCAGRRPSWLAGGVACWLAFAVAGGFSHVGERGWLWVLPGAWLLAAGVVRARERAWPGWRNAGFVGGAAAVAMGGIVLLGRPWEGPRLRDGVVELRGEGAEGSNRQRVSVLAGGEARQRMGQWVRGRLPRGMVVECAWEDGAAMRGEALLLVGGVDDPRLATGTALRKVVWISPERVLPWTLPAQIQGVPIVVLSGQFATATMAPWRKYFAEGGRGEWKMVPRQGDFLSDPWGRLLEEAGKR